VVSLPMSQVRTTPTVLVVTAPEDHPWPGLEPLEEHATVLRATDESSVVDQIGRADVLLVTDFRTDVIRLAWPRAERLKWVHATSAGVDALLIPEIVESDVPVTNAAGIFDRSIAEYVVMLIVAHAKDLYTTYRLQSQHRWRHRDTRRIEGDRVLIVGAGSIGREIGKLVGGLGMDAVGVARSARSGDPCFREVRPASELHDLLPAFDYVVLATPLTEETRGMMGADELARMKRSAYLINVGRGAVVQTPALVRALEQGQIAGAALDVMEEEPLPREHPLWDFPQVLISPHMAGDFVGWRKALSRQFLERFEAWLRGEPLTGLVDKHKGYVPTKEIHDDDD
jgi:phosphoglycerate dehydrogenase-like enzyme